MAEYRDIKSNIFKNQNEDDYSVISTDDKYSKYIADKKLKSKIVLFTRSDLSFNKNLPHNFEAIEKVLSKAGWNKSDVDLFEVNEAFAPVPLSWAIELKADMSKLNVNGGAMALGHPLGATGAKLMTTLLHELERREGKYALQAICEGGGTANATIIERI